MKYAASAVIVTTLLSIGGAAQNDQRVASSPGCTWTPKTGRTVEVRNIDALERAVQDARSGDTILLADGDYRLRRTIEISTPNLTLRSRSRTRDAVVLRGGGMTGDNVGVAVGVGARDVTIADVTIRDVGFHAVQVRGEAGASGFLLHNARLMDAGQQLLKGSLSDRPIYADGGTVACSEFSYSTHAPSDYTNGVDLLGTKGWTIRDNRFIRIRGPEAGRWAAGPAILVWAAAEDTIVERNVIVDSFRGIALGLAAGTASATRGGQKAYDHLGGIIRNNVVVNLNGWADEAIEGNAARDIRIERNTVLVEGASVGWSIALRFPMAAGVVRNNLTNRQVLMRDGATAMEQGNITNAAREWFVDPAAADLRLVEGRRGMDAGAVADR